jgi:glycine/D-amino acid oxidase-like deaminating enzyme
MAVTRVGILGVSEGNGHPFSFSAIINGYDDAGLAASGWPGIYDYVRRRDASEFGIGELQVTHAWTGNVAFTFDFLPHIGVQGGVHYAAGCQGSGVAMATWLGHRAALKIAGAENEPFALDGLRFPSLPLYNGNPNWFRPLIGGWYRLRDRMDRAAA